MELHHLAAVMLSAASEANEHIIAEVRTVVALHRVATLIELICVSAAVGDRVRSCSVLLKRSEARPVLTGTMSCEARIWQ